MPVQCRYISVILVCMVLMPFLSAAANESSDEIRITLANMEDDAEDMVDAALAKDAVSSQKLYKKIQHNIDQLHHGLAGHAFDERRSRELLMAYSWIRVITIDLKQSAWVGTAIAANQLSASIIRFTNYPTLRQRDIAWMDYLGRELLLLNMEDAGANNQLLVARHADLVETWLRIRKALLTSDFRNKSLVLQGDKLIRTLQGDQQPQHTIEIAGKLLDFVDKVEQAK